MERVDTAPYFEGRNLPGRFQFAWSHDTKFTLMQGVTSAPTRAGVRLSEPHHPTRLAKAKLKGHVCDISLEPHSIFLDNPQGENSEGSW